MSEQKSHYSVEEIKAILPKPVKALLASGKLSVVPSMTDLPNELQSIRVANTRIIDGIERPTTNSNGQPIAQTEQGLRNFWRWFGDSEVVDDQGRPLVVYHGTTAEFNTFSLDFLGEGNGSSDWGDGFYFTDNPTAAADYADDNGGHILSVYLAITNPATKQDMMDSDVQNALDDGMGFTTVEAVLVGKGHSGIAIDHGGDGFEYIAFNPTQIKSAMGNSGEFDSSHNSILFSSAIGSPEEQSSTTKNKLVMVDGIERPTINSNGQPIHSSEEGLRNFWRWFGDSKAIDGEGRPLVVYHGTADDFDQLDVDHPNRHDSGWLGKGGYTTTSSDIASAYSNIKAGVAGPNVMPLYDNLKNPYQATIEDKRRLQTISHNQGKAAGLAAAEMWTDELKSQGYDGVILDYSASMVGESQVSKEIVVFEPNQIKSAIGNTGEFSHQSPSILHSEQPSATIQGLYDEQHDQIYLVADQLNQQNFESVLMHELFHRAESTDVKLQRAMARFHEQLSERFNLAKLGKATSIEQRALNRVLSAKTPEKDQLSEFKAYLVSEYSRQPNDLLSSIKKAIADLIAAIRAVLIRNGLDREHIQSIKPADLAALARYGQNASQSAINPSTTLRASIAGVKAETADINQLLIASKMREKKANPDEIWRQTGWYLGDDEHWRFELDDSQAALVPDVKDRLESIIETVNRTKQAMHWTLGEVFSHPLLFKAYPNISTLRVNLIPDAGEHYEGMANLREGTINIVARPSVTIDELESTLLHEIQHMIQAKEHFANGGDISDQTVQHVLRFLRQKSEEKFDSVTYEHYNRLAEKLAELNRLKRWDDLIDYADRDSITRNSKLIYHCHEYRTHYREVWDNVGYPPKKYKTDQHREWLQATAMYLANKMQDDNAGPRFGAQLTQLKNDGGENALKNAIARTERAIAKTRPVIIAFDHAKAKLDQATKLSQEGVNGLSWNAKRDFYMSLAGEVEARMVETRRHYTPEQRANQLPYYAEDRYRETKVLSPASQFVSFFKQDTMTETHEESNIERPLF